MKRITYEEIKPYIEKRLVSEQAHPENENIRIFNYTQTCQFEGAWDDITKQCRGLIIDISTNEILARPFPKFFNYQEYIAKNWDIPSEVPIITEKLDGSLGILYWLNDIPRIATRGSFISEQSQWATDYILRNPFPFKNDGITRLFEIIYPENRIVVNYDFSGLVYLAGINTETGKQREEEQLPIKSAKIIPASNLTELEKLDEPNSEGFVAYYPNADLRIKLKFPEYVRLHKLVTGVSEIAIWEHLRDGNGLEDLLEKVPDEFFKWVQRVQNELKTKFDKLWQEAQATLKVVSQKETRKEQALEVMATSKHISGIIFSLLDNQDLKAKEQIWKMIRPHGRSGFKTDIDL